MTSRIFSFLLPTLIVLVGFAAVVSVAHVGFLQSAGEPPAFASPGGLSAKDLGGVDLKNVVLPRPALAPEEIVRLQLAGLSRTEPDGVGILQCYCFASPANRQVTGPLDRFGAMVRQGPFACLARPAVVLIGRPQYEGPVARLLVTIIDAQEQIRAFTFVLARQQDPPFHDCWMTEAVFPALPADHSPPPSKVGERPRRRGAREGINNDTTAFPAQSASTVLL